MKRPNITRGGRSLCRKVSGGAEGLHHKSERGAYVVMESGGAYAAITMQRITMRITMLRKRLLEENRL